MLDRCVSDVVEKLFELLGNSVVYLSCGARVLCHFFRAASFSPSFCFTISGHTRWGCCFLMGGVACQTACCMTVVRLWTASSRSAVVFSGIFKLICVFSCSLNTSQFVFLLYNDGFLVVVGSRCACSL